MSNVRILEDLLGYKIVAVDLEDHIDGDIITFHREDGKVVKMYHEQCCCEYVRIEDIDGDLQDLIGTIIEAEEVTKEGEDEYGTMTWTFYKIASENGFVNIRWYGTSNGYYSESVTVEVFEGEHQ